MEDNSFLVIKNQEGIGYQSNIRIEQMERKQSRIKGEIIKQI